MCTAIAISLVVPCAPAQEGPLRPAFDVVSVKASAHPNEGAESMDCKDGHFVSHEFPVAFLVRWSFQLNASRIVGLPDWTSDWNAGYEIEAKSDAPASNEQCRLMVQQLLAGRFRMTSHMKTQPMQSLLLTTSDGGKRLRDATQFNGNSGAKINGQTVGDLPENQGLSMRRLAQLLGAHPRVGMPVIDQTGLDGRFVFSLAFSLRDDDSKPSIFTALKELGMKLEPAKTQLEVPVVDHIERAGVN